MNKRQSTDYHDYVIRDGKLIGEFEAMYRNSVDIPWHQNQQDDWIDVRLTTQLLLDLAPFAEIHDLGCGLGYYLDLLRKSLGAQTCRGFGYDVSATACERARQLFPHFSFSALDLTSSPPDSRSERSEAKRLFAIRGTLWYVFPHIRNVVRLIRSRMHGGDKLLVVQNFPPLNSSFVGKDVIPDHQALIRHFSAEFGPARHVWYEDTLKRVNDNWFIGLFVPSEAS